MKRLLSMLLVFCLLFVPSTGIAGEAISLTREDIPLAEQDAAALARLGLFYGRDGDMALASEVTRAEAVVLLDRLFSPLEQGEAAASPFQDVTESHAWAQGAIARFYQRGWIRGVSDTAFAPDRTVSGTEFSSILLAGLGYQQVRPRKRL